MPDRKSTFSPIQHYSAGCNDLFLERGTMKPTCNNNKHLVKSVCVWQDTVYSIIKTNLRRERERELLGIHSTVV